MSLPTLKLRFWPFALFVMLAFAIAYNLIPILEWLGGNRSLNVSVLFGLSIGGLSVLAVLAGLCGRTMIQGIAVASLLAAAVFLTNVFSDYLRISAANPGLSVGSFLNTATHAFNFPILVVALVTPMAIARWKSKHYLSTSAGRPKPRVSLERLLLWTTIAACLLYYCRVPMEVMSFDIRQLAVYLPGLMAISVTNCVVHVLPTIRWAFLPKLQWWHWLVVTGGSIVGHFILAGLFNIVLTQWTQFAYRNFSEFATICLSGCSFYLLGLWSLRASGFRWVTYCAESALGQSRDARADSWAARVWTGTFVAFAVMTTVILARFKHNEEVRLARFVEIANEMSIAGGSIQVHGQEILGVTLSSLSRESIPAELRDSATLRWLSIKSSSVSDDDLEQLQQWPNLLTVDLSDTNVTDAVFPYLEGRNIYSLDLSNTKVTAAGLAKYLKAHSCVRSVAFRNMQLTDDQLPSLYQPNIVVWDLASNRLTDQGVKALWENDLVGGLNLSANPITSAAFDATTRSALVQLTCEDCPIDDPTVNKLVVAGLVNYIHLGKTGITPQGLASLMSNCGILLRPGSFSEEELGSIDPACGNVSLSIVDCQVTGDFLTKWTRQPISLTMMRTKLSDEQVIAWSKTNWRPRSLFFFGHDLTDRCLPALRKLGPTHLQIAHGRISAAGLIEQIPTTTNLVIDACDYSPQELRLLRKSFPHITVQVYPFDYSR